MTPESRKKLEKLLEIHEGRVRTMYPDSDGNVTVAVGHLLPNAAAASRLPFLLLGLPGQAKASATAEHIEMAWNYTRDNRRPYRGLELSDADIDKLRDEDIDEAIAVLGRTFDLNSIPESAQIGLGDMAFNLGSFHKFPKLVEAVKAGDWKTAADECQRRGISDSRNEDTRRLLLAAVEA